MIARLRRLGLRSRLTASFAVGALVLSLLIALLSYTIARGYLIDQREQNAVRQSREHANTVDAALQTQGVALAQILSSLRPANSQSLVNYRGNWYSSSSGVGPADLPFRLREAVNAGHAVKQRTAVGGNRSLIVGIPLADVDATYFEILPLTELQSTLNTIRTTLLLVALGAALVAGLLGRWVSGRLLQPLYRVAATSRTIANGDLKARLPDTPDRQLAVLTLSFNEMADSLARRIERDARFAADVSHELRSPLTTLATSLSVLQGRRRELSHPSAAALDLLGNEVNRFQALVEDLLDISRADAGTDGHREPVLLAELVRQVCVHRSETFRSGMPVAPKIAPEAQGVLVSADKRRLVRVLVNLLDNARSHGGGATLVRMTATCSHVAVIVEDDGPGVPASDRERIFERFSRAAASGRRGGSGTGLGLALVREHVNAHQGTVSVDRADTGGARFVVTLPRLLS